MSKSIHLNVKEVIADSGPLRAIYTMALASDWHIPRECVWSLTGEKCDKPSTAIYVLNEPLRGFGGGEGGFRMVCVCREHDKVLREPDHPAAEVDDD